MIKYNFLQIFDKNSKEQRMINNSVKQLCLNCFKSFKKRNQKNKDVYGTFLIDSEFVYYSVNKTIYCLFVNKGIIYGQIEIFKEDFGAYEINFKVTD